MQRTTIPAMNASGTIRLPHCVAAAAPIRQHDTAPAPTPAESLYAATLARITRQAAAEIAANPGLPTVNHAVWGNNSVTAIEPAFCTRQHATEGRGEHPEDIYHASTETAVEVTRASGGKETLLSGWIAVNPYSLADSEPRGAICFPTGDCEDYDGPGLVRLAAELRAAAAWVDSLGAQLAAVQNGDR
jgi:hypothetical protein